MTKHKEEIEEIEEEKEELEIQNTCLISDTYNEVSMTQYEDMQEDYEEEIQKLKRENDILNAYREEQTKIEKIIGDDDLIGRKVEDIVDIAPYIEKLKRENEGLKEKIEEQEYQIQEQREIIDELD